MQNIINHRVKKNFGQNFLNDKNILNKILARAAISKSDIILEIGPGKGFMTDFLLENAQKVVAIEIDKALIEFLMQKYNEENRFFMIKGDCLKKDWKLDAIIPNKLIANIPYNITSPIIFKMLDYFNSLEKIILMMQKEVADRIIANPNTKNFGVLSCIVQKFWDVEKFQKVSKTVFYPQPKIDSALVEFKPKFLAADDLDNKKNFVDFVKFCFKERRKILFPRLIKNQIFSEESLEKFYKKYNLDKKVRPENLQVEIFWDLSLSNQKFRSDGNEK